MSSISKMIDCPKCGSTHADENGDFKDRTININCFECGYHKEIKYSLNLDFDRVYENKIN